MQQSCSMRNHNTCSPVVLSNLFRRLGPYVSDASTLQGITARTELEYPLSSPLLFTAVTA